MKGSSPFPVDTSRAEFNTMLIDQYKRQERSGDKVKEHNTLASFVHQRGAGFNFKSTPIGTRHDAIILLNGRPIAMAEVKHRNNTKDSYPTYQIDKDKIDNLISKAAVSNIQAILIVSWLGDIQYINLTVAYSEFKESGRLELFPAQMVKRRDRDELADLQYQIPLHLFKKPCSN